MFHFEFVPQQLYKTTAYAQDFFSNTVDATEESPFDNECPFIENICIKQDSLYVINANDTFILDGVWHILGSGPHIEGKWQSEYHYNKYFSTNVWSKENIINSKCIYMDTKNNYVVVIARYMRMIGEYYHRFIFHLFQFYAHKILPLAKENKDMLKNFYSTQYYLVLPEKHHILTPTMTAIIDPFTEYMPLEYWRLFETSNCHCFHKLYFCGAKFQNKTISESFMFPNASIPKNWTKETDDTDMNKMVRLYHNYVTTKYDNLYNETMVYKLNLLEKHLNKNVSMNEINHWKIICFYARYHRRQWLNIKEMVNNCNNEYNRYNILCIIFSFDDIDKYVNVHDLIISHQSFDVIIGLDGSDLINAVFMKPNGSYLINLMRPTDKPWANDVRYFTSNNQHLVMSKYNCIGVHTVEQSKYFPEIDQNEWWGSKNFKTKWWNIKSVFDLLFINTTIKHVKKRDFYNICNQYAVWKQYKKDNITYNVPHHFNSSLVYNTTFVYNLHCPHLSNYSYVFWKSIMRRICNVKSSCIYSNQLTMA